MLHVRAITGLIFAIAIAFAIIAAFDAPTFGTWVTLFGVACVPVQIILGVVLEGRYPAMLMRLEQPARGLARLAITLVIGALITFAACIGFARHLATPGPMLLIYMIFSVVVAFWFCIVWGAWPLRAVIKHPLALAASTLVAIYAISYVLFSILFNFQFLVGAPVYVAARDPSGLFDANMALSFAVSTVAALFVWLLFDFWPLSRFERLGRQPMFGIAASLVLLLAVGMVWTVGVRVNGIDPIVFMVFGSVSLLFGCLIPLQKYQGRLLSGMKQPARGVSLLILAAALGYLLSHFYFVMMPVLTGNLPAGAANGYQAENWLAAALLAVTFPIIVVICEFFELWPLPSTPEAEAGEGQ